MKRLAYFFCIAVASAAWLFASWPALHALNAKWTDVGDSYVLGYPLLVAAVWLIYQRRAKLFATRPAPSWIGVLCFAAIMLIVYAARLIQLQIVPQIMFPLSLWCLFFALLGWPVARSLILPLGLQYFGVPVWDLFLGILQKMTIVVAHLGLGGLNIPVWLERNHIHLPDGVITVADSCSGLNLLLAALLTATLQSEMGRYTTYRRIALLFVAGLIGLLDNWIRVLALILIAHYSHMQNPLIYSHAGFGWWIYAVSLVPFFLIARRLELPSTEDVVKRRPEQEMPRIPLWHLSTLLAVIVIGECVSKMLSERAGRVVEMQVSGNARATEPEFMPQYSGFDRQQAWEIGTADDRYELSAFIYTQQQEGKKLIYYKNVIAPDSQLGESGTVQIGTQMLNFAVVNTLQPRLVWWYYWVDNAMTASPLKAKLYQLRAALTGDPSAALVVLSSQCANDRCRRELEEVHNSEHQKIFAQMFSLTGLTRARTITR